MPIKPSQLIIAGAVGVTLFYNYRESKNEATRKLGTEKGGIKEGKVSIN